MLGIDVFIVLWEHIWVKHSTCAFIQVILKSSLGEHSWILFVHLRQYIFNSSFNISRRRCFVLMQHLNLEWSILPSLSLIVPTRSWVHEADCTKLRRWINGKNTSQSRLRAQFTAAFTCERSLNTPYFPCEWLNQSTITDLPRIFCWPHYKNHLLGCVLYRVGIVLLSSFCMLIPVSVPKLIDDVWK